jgi:signal transduction histidine kinase
LDSQPSSDQTALAQAAKLLTDHSNTILKRWSEYAREKIPAARNQSKPALYDALPIFLREVAESLNPASSKETPAAEVGREHGEQRSTLTEYTLRQVIEEYELLLETIFDILESKGELPVIARKMIRRSVMTGIKDACAEFTRIQDSTRERFIAVLTHDLRNPLSAAKTSTQMIHRVGDNRAKVDVLAGKAISSINRVESMLQDLLDTFQVRAGRPLPVQIEQNDLCGVTRETVEELSTVHGARFLMKAPASVVAHFSSDGIRRSIENLVNNAVKYGDPLKPITISISELADESVEISVHNFGNPLNAEEKAKLFTPYHRAMEAKTSGIQGWGLGLILVQGVTKAHSGEVRVKSTEVEGTEFTMHFPRNPPIPGPTDPAA